MLVDDQVIDDQVIAEETQKLINNILQQIELARSNHKLKKKDLAERTGMSKSQITNILQGQNLTLKTLVRLGLACDLRWNLTAASLQAEGFPVLVA